jgi:hypothetical protein
MLFVGPLLRSPFIDLSIGPVPRTSVAEGVGIRFDPRYFLLLEALVEYGAAVPELEFIGLVFVGRVFYEKAFGTTQRAFTFSHGRSSFLFPHNTNPVKGEKLPFPGFLCV